MALNILVTGANGQLGQSLRKLAPQSPHRFIFTDVTELASFETVYLDITHPAAIDLIFASEEIDVVINAAAYTNVDKAEDDQRTANLLNHMAPRYLAEAARKRDALLVHVSSDYVYGGNASIPYREDFPTAPAGVYAATKLQGDQAVIGIGGRYLIFRTSWLYSPYGKNFVKTICRLCAEREHISVVFDQVGTPTYAPDLAQAILAAVDCYFASPKELKGIYHFSNEGVTSWYDFACAIRDLGGYRCAVLPCHSDEFPSKVHRPHYSVLDKSRYREVFSAEIPHWYSSLRECMTLLTPASI